MPQTLSAAVRKGNAGSSRVPGLRMLRNRTRAGFSLTEMLATILIMALVGSIAVNAIPAARTAYLAATDAANAQTLVSTTATQLRSLLSVAKPSTVKTGEDAIEAVRQEQEVQAADAADAAEAEPRYNASDVLVRFESYETGYTTTILNDDEQGLSVVEENAYGISPTNGEPAPLVPSAAAAGAGAGNLRVSIDGGIGYSNGVFTASAVHVYRGNDEVGAVKAGALKVKTIATVAQDSGTP